jgi:hypothetical protein
MPSIRGDGTLTDKAAAETEASANAIKQTAVPVVANIDPDISVRTIQYTTVNPHIPAANAKTG